MSNRLRFATHAKPPSYRSALGSFGRFSSAGGADAMTNLNLNLVDKYALIFYDCNWMNR